MIHDAYFDHMTPGEQKRFLRYRRRMEVSAAVRGTTHKITLYYSLMADKLIVAAMRRQAEQRKVVG
ncbi:MAG: hypothetical protein M0021_09600 [Clostridia bacterium]|nr:hypothetical protein [Clostridia bacterium]